MRKQLAVAATGAMLTALLPLGSTALADGQPPQIIAGTLVDDQGSPVAASITVRVEHSTPEGDVETPIATGFTTPSGQFIIRGGLGNTPATLNPDGSVQLEVDAQANGQDRLFTLAATPPNPTVGRPDWTWGDAADPSLLPPQANANAQAHQPLSGLRLDSGSTLDAATTNTTSTASVCDCCGGISAQYIWKNMDEWTWRSPPVMHFTLLERTWWKYTWTSTAQTQIGIAVETPTVENYSEGLSYSQLQNYSTSEGPFKHDTNYWNGTARMEWRFRHQKQVCRITYASGASQDTPTGYYRWKAWNFTGGNSGPSDSFGYACNYSSHHDTTITAPLTTSNGYTELFKGWFNIAGVNLNASQTTSGATALTAGVKAGYAKARICGDGAAPAWAPLFWEEPL